MADVGVCGGCGGEWGISGWCTGCEGWVWGMWRVGIVMGGGFVFDKHRTQIGNMPITDHNCVIDWERAKVMDRETDRCAHCIKEGCQWWLKRRLSRNY